MTDVTRDAGIRFTHSHGGSGRHYFLEQNTGGCAFLDYDGDGWQDLFLPQGAPLPGYKGADPLRSALYHNNRDGTFRDVTQGSGLDVEMYAMAPAVGDYDNDGRPDLFVSAFGGNRLFRNQGNGKFRDVTKTAGVKGRDLPHSAAWVDYDHDGRLDLFVCCYTEYSLEKDVPCKNKQGKYIYCQPTDYKGTRPQLYRNNGNGTFTDVTLKSRIGSPTVSARGRVMAYPSGATQAQMSSKGPAIGRSMGVACADFNEDGWIDIYVANDQSLNFLFFNNGDGTFREEADMVGASRGPRGQNSFAGMGVDSGDYRNEGRMGIVVTNFTLEPISLYRNISDGNFINETRTSRIELPSVPYVKWGVRFVDLDLDGWQDLFVVNGHVFEDYQGKQLETVNERGETQVLTYSYKQPCQVFRNEQGRFKDVSTQSGSFFKRTQVGRGAAFGDYDNDGDTDVLVACNNQPTILLRNVTEHRSQWLRLELKGSATPEHWGCNRDALGAMVRVQANGLTQTQYVRSGTSYMADHDRRLLFGVGREQQADVEIRWPCGAVQKLQVEAGVSTLVKEDSCNLGKKSSESSKPSVD